MHRQPVSASWTPSCVGPPQHHPHTFLRASGWLRHPKAKSCEACDLVKFITERNRQTVGFTICESYMFTTLKITHTYTLRHVL